MLADWMGKGRQTGLFVFQTKTELPDTDTVTLPHSQSPVRAVLPPLSILAANDAHSSVAACPVCVWSMDEWMDGWTKGRVRCLPAGCLLFVVHCLQ